MSRWSALFSQPMMLALPPQPEWRGDQAWAFTRGGLLLTACLMLFAAGSQLLFSVNPLYSSTGYAVLGLTALVTALLMFKGSRGAVLRKFVQRVSVGLVAGSLLIGFLPGTQSYVFLLVLFSILFGFWGSSALIFPIASAIGWCLLGLFSLCVMISGISPFATAGAAVIATSLCGLFALTMAYGYRQVVAFVLLQEYENEPADVPAKAAAVSRKEEPVEIAADASQKWAAILKNTAIEMAGTQDVEAMYKKMLARIKSSIPCDIVVLGKLQNRIMFPVAMLDKNGQRNVDGSLRMIWSLALLDELDAKKDVHTGLSDAALLDSFFDAGKVPFGYRLDIPFFAQKKLSGVISLFRQKQSFSRYETDLASSIVFHGMFAHRSALLQGRVSNLTTQTLMSTTQSINPAVGKQETEKPEPDKARGNVLPSEEFIQKADSGFRHLEKTGKPVSLLLIEVDGYKNFARTYTEQSVVRLFSQLSVLLQANLPAGSLFGRYGKASFAVQVSMEPNQARQLAEQLRYLVQKRAFKMDETRESITVSIGVSSRTPKTLDFLAVLKCADIGLYKAKYGTGNTVHVNV
ncbi:MAG TPA: GGDEF domain-containing protein [Gammaproteobacteria bacterium]